MESCSKCCAIISIYTKNAIEMHKASRSCNLIQCTICHVKYPFLMRIEHGTQQVRESRNIETEWSQSNVFVVPEFVIEKDYEELYVRHKKQIRPSRSVRTLTAVYNFQMNRLSIEEVKEYLLLVFKDQKTSVKIKISLALILRNNEDQSLHYYY